jgi:hypothetical protein
VSDLRRTARCIDCGQWISGTSALEWTDEHVDVHPEHRVIFTRSGNVDVADERGSGDG